LVGLFKLLGVVVLTIVGLVIFTQYGPDGLDSTTTLLGWPVVSIRGEDARGLIAIGQTAFGVVVFAQGGGGLITIAQVGVGVLFGIGQLMGGMLAIAQLGVGISFFVGQVGGGAQALGQGVLGKSVSAYGKEMSAEIGAMLSFSGADSTLPTPASTGINLTGKGPRVSRADRRE
jgi:hypothetical protein